MTNIELYERFRAVPEEAKKTITAGRLKGMTDISPMWRIKRLTEEFGPCGIGWKYKDVHMQLVPGANSEIAMFVSLNLLYKSDGKWSDPIPGIGGSMFVAKESKGMYTDDEAYKKALTDALSVACKALGIGADVYFSKDRTKYTGPQSQQEPLATESQQPFPWEEESNVVLPWEDDKPACSVCGKGVTEAEKKYSQSKYGKIACRACQRTL